MNTAIEKSTPQPKASALAVMASRLNCDPVKLHSTLTNTVFKGASPDELLALVLVANEYRLNPLTKQIYAFPGKGGGITPIVSIDGWCAVVNRQPDLDGLEFEFEDTEDGKPGSCTCVIYIKGRSRPVRVTEFYSECYRKTDPWTQMPRRMLRHKALIQCARVAFGLSGIYDQDEAIDVVSERMPDESPAKKVTFKKAEPKTEPEIEPEPEPDTDPTVLNEDSDKAVLAGFVESEGFTFDEFRRWGAETGVLEDADEWDGWHAVPEVTATRLLKARKGLITGLATFKAAKR